MGDVYYQRHQHSEHRTLFDMATLQFLGAAQEVTGSCHLLQSPVLGSVLLDCGMHQGGSTTERLGQEHFAFDARQIDAVVLSHAHLDHSGLLPKLVHDGFRGPIYCTNATAELLNIMLHDSAGLYQRDLEYKNRRLARRGQKQLNPVYVKNDVTKALKQQPAVVDRPGSTYLSRRRTYSWIIDCRNHPG